MMTNKISGAASLDAVEKRFQQWRDGHEGRVRIPEELWSAAAAAARVHGLHSTARRFVELTSAAIGQPRCTVELHNAVGATLRIELQGGDLSALSGITHAFMGVA